MTQSEKQNRTSSDFTQRTIWPCVCARQLARVIPPSGRAGPSAPVTSGDFATTGVREGRRGSAPVPLCLLARARFSVSSSWNSSSFPLVPRLFHLPLFWKACKNRILNGDTGSPSPSGLLQSIPPDCRGRLIWWRDFFNALLLHDTLTPGGEGAQPQVRAPWALTSPCLSCAPTGGGEGEVAEAKRTAEDSYVPRLFWAVTGGPGGARPGLRLSCFAEPSLRWIDLRNRVLDGPPRAQLPAA